MTATKWEQTHDRRNPTYIPYWLSPHTASAVLEAWIKFFQSARSGSAEESLEQRFRRLGDQWKASVGSISNPDDIRAARGYAELVALGRPLIPLILRELDSDPFHWFEVLADITGIDPTPPEQAGDVDAMVAAWKGWARKQRTK